MKPAPYLFSGPNWLYGAFGGKIVPDENFAQFCLKSPLDENQQALLKDPLHVPVGPITRARSKKIKEALNGLIQDIWADSPTGHSKLGPKEDEGVINLIQATDGAEHA
jgi:hypothetical protein